MAAGAAGVGALVEPLADPDGDDFALPNIPMLILNLDGSPFNMDGVAAAAAPAAFVVLSFPPTAFPSLTPGTSPSAPSGPAEASASAAAGATRPSVSTRSSCGFGSGCTSAAPEEGDSVTAPSTTLGAPAEQPAEAPVGLGTTPEGLPKIPMPLFIFSISSMEGVFSIAFVSAACFSVFAAASPPVAPPGSEASPRSAAPSTTPAVLPSVIVGGASPPVPTAVPPVSSPAGALLFASAVASPFTAFTPATATVPAAPGTAADDEEPPTPSSGAAPDGARVLDAAVAVGSVVSGAASGLIALGAASVTTVGSAAAAEDMVDGLELWPSPVVGVVAPGAPPTHCDTGLVISAKEKAAGKQRGC